MTLGYSKKATRICWPGHDCVRFVLPTGLNCANGLIDKPTLYRKETMKLSDMSLSQLRDLQKQLAVELQRRNQAEIECARQQVLAIAASAGMSLAALLAIPERGASLKGKSVPVRYRHPQDATLQWTGRGRAPLWVATWVNEHGNRDGLRIADTNQSVNGDQA
jgi:DNA-binding protein H-NS